MEWTDVKIGDVLSIGDMSRNLWIAWCWKNITEAGNEDIKYLCVGLRPIEDAKDAADQFDARLPLGLVA